MYKTIAYLALLESAGLLGFILTSSYQAKAPFRFVPLAIMLVAIGCIAFFKAKALSRKEVVYVSVAVSAIFILIVQLLGFTIYPGLAKDIDFFSGENAARTGLMLLIFTTGHFMLLTLACVGRIK